MDGRRHSLDIPISKTLLALRRVRSLRDPSTNSMSKLSASVDNLIWDTNTINSVTLGFGDCCKEGIASKPMPKLKDIGRHGLREEHVNDLELVNGLIMPNTKLNLCESSDCFGRTVSAPVWAKQVVSSKSLGPDQEVIIEKDLSYCDGFTQNGLELTCITPSNNFMEGVGSCNEPGEESFQADSLDHHALTQNPQHKKQTKSSSVLMGDSMADVDSLCLITPEGLSGTLLIGNEDADFVEWAHRGCGISSCWSGTPRFRDFNLPFDVEDMPLLSGEVCETKLCRKGKASKYLKNDISQYSGSPWNLSQKFRPKFFSDLVGQNVVASSLLNAISNARISSLYLFHGPRGTGKTSASKIFAAALNCLSLQEDKPCGVCRECVSFFSGRSRDVMEVDSVRINNKNGIGSLIKHTSIPPVSSRFKVFIIDECHLLQQETWVAFLNSSADLAQYVVFLMITPDLKKLPQTAVSRSQVYHFPKINEAVIARRLAKICLEEGFEFEEGALDLIATKSNGSLRDAEMTIEHLSLLGKRITMPLVYELIGIVSDDELLDLLDLALSSDSSKTIRRARELMGSGIDPMQLGSQLANLIMDILAGKYDEGSSEVRKKFFSRHNSEASLKQLSNAVKILSETEKQLKMSKCQATWLTVALLQFNSVGCSLLDLSDLRSCDRTIHLRDGDFCSRSSTSESRKLLATCDCHGNKPGMQDSGETLQMIWKRALTTCQSNSLKHFLKREGKLSSICFNQGVAVVQLEFCRPGHVNKAEKSWKSIANALQVVLGCNVEIRINLAPCASSTKYAKRKKPCFRFFSSHKLLCHKSQSTSEDGSSKSENLNSSSEKAIISSEYNETCSSNCGPQFSQNCCMRNKGASIIRSNEGNALSIGATNGRCEATSDREAEKQPHCFSRFLKFQKKMNSSNTSQNSCTRFPPQGNPVMSIPVKTI